MSRLTRKTNARDYCSYCRVVELLIEREQKPKDDFYDEPEQYYERWPYQEAICGDDEERLIKLGKLEDLMEEYNIDSIEELEILINSHKKLGEKIIDLSADLGMFQNENINLAEDIEKYWNIEQQFGCSLEVVVKALKDGYIYVYDNHYNVDGYTKTNAKITFNNDKFYIGFARNTRRLQDYRKTWWLKGEKENAN